MWFRRDKKPKTQFVVASNYRAPKEFKIAAGKGDTDHSTGIGLVAVTGTYDSNHDSFSIEPTCALGKSITAHGKYGVTDEKVLSLGLESRFSAFGRRNTVDVSYAPHSDSATMKLSMRQSRVKLSGIFQFDQFRAERLKEHSEKYEMDARLNALESVKMSFNAKNNAAKFKFIRKLDSKNHVDAEYSYGSPGRRFVTLCFKHLYSPRNTFALKANYGSKKFNFQWDLKTNSGPWTLSTDFMFTKSPGVGQWVIKRRFEF